MQAVELGVMPIENPTVHVCMVAPFAYPAFSQRKGPGKAGGSDIQLMLLGRALSHSGYRVTFVVNDHEGEGVELHNGVEVVKTRFRYFGGSNSYFLPDFISLFYICDPAWRKHTFYLV